MATAKQEDVAPVELKHPSLRPRKKQAKLSDKQRRTMVRVAKLINLADNTSPRGRGIVPTLIECPIGPGTNNRGSKDPNAPLRYYLEVKGFLWPHEYDREKYPGIYCAISRCWDWATIPHDPESGTERCIEHEAMWRAGLLRYLDPAVQQGKNLDDYIREMNSMYLRRDERRDDV